MNKMNKTAASLGLCLAVFATGAMGDAHSAKMAENAVDARENQMDLIAYNIGILGSMAKGETPYDATMAVSAATNINALSKLDPAALWIEGTEQGAVEDSRAKPEIWTDAAGFAEKFSGLESASAEMITAAGTDLDAIKATMGKVGGACKACHESYRGPEND